MKNIAKTCLAIMILSLRAHYVPKLTPAPVTESTEEQTVTDIPPTVSPASKVEPVKASEWKPG